MSAQVIPFAPRPQTPPDDAPFDLVDDGIDLCQDLIAYFDREIARLSPAGVELHMDLQRRSSGTRRTFWVSDLNGPKFNKFPPQHRLYPPPEKWDAHVLKSIADDVARDVPGHTDGAPYVLELLDRRSGYAAQGSYLSLCVRIGRWRATIGGFWQNQLPPSVREILRALPVTEDSWTQTDAEHEEEQAARTRELNAKLLKVRHALAARPDAWPAIALIIEDDDDEQRGGA